MRSAAVPVSTFLAQAARSSRNQSRACLRNRRPLRLPEPGRVVAMTAAGQGGGAGGVEPVTGAEVLGQLGCGRERLGIEASGRGVVLLDETEFRQVEAVGGGGPVLSLDDGGETTFQGAQVPAALQLAFEVSAEVLLPSGSQVEAAPDLGLGLGELTPGEQRLAQGPMGPGRNKVRAGRPGGSGRWLPSVGPRPAGECGACYGPGPTSGSQS